MPQKIPLLLGVSVLYTLITTILAASPTSFCKCTCFTNSTIIALDAPDPMSPKHSSHAFLFPRAPNPEQEQGHEPNHETEEPLPQDPPLSSPTEGNVRDGRKGDKDGKKGKEEEDRKEYRAGNCNDCNRQFCLDYNLPICRGAGMEDVFTTCFQRDSRKDEAVVFIFIFATAGLLIWAGIKPWVGKWIASARERRSYIPVPREGDT